MKMYRMAVLTVITYPIFTCAMQMDSNAPAVKPAEESDYAGENIDRGLMCLCGPCNRAGNLISEKISERLTGEKLPMAVSCQGCSLCSMQLLMCSLLSHGQNDAELRNDKLATVCAVSAAGTACLAYIARRIDRCQLRQQAACADHAKVE